jgi:hypothetical protein
MYLLDRKVNLYYTVVLSGYQPSWKLEVISDKAKVQKFCIQATNYSKNKIKQSQK